MTTKIDKPLYTVKDLSFLFKVTRQTISKLMRNGDLHAIRLGGSVRFSPAEVERYVRQCGR